MFKYLEGRCRHYCWLFYYPKYIVSSILHCWWWDSTEIRTASRDIIDFNYHQHNHFNCSQSYVTCSCNCSINDLTLNWTSSTVHKLLMTFSDRLQSFSCEGNCLFLCKCLEQNLFVFLFQDVVWEVFFFWSGSIVTFSRALLDKLILWRLFCLRISN